MEILKFSLGQLQANCYFLIEREECLIIDPADEGSFILEELQRRKLKPVGMLATHGHFDHIMAAGEIQKSFNTPLFIRSEDIFLIKRIKETAKYFLGFNPVIIEPTTINRLIVVENKSINFRISSFEFRILGTPGHSPGSCCFYFSEEKIIFTGDTLFKGGIGRYDFSYSDKNDLKKSLKDLIKFPKDTIVYPGHGEKTTIRSEKDFAFRLF